MVNEKDLINGCLRENRNCQEEVFRLFAGKMLAVCRRYTRHPMEAEDLLQDAFIKVFDNISQYQFKGPFEAWIRRIVVNTALKNYRRKGSRNEQLGLEQEAFDLPVEPSIFSHLHEEELLSIISRLPDGYRMVFNLYAIEGYSHREISEMLDIEEGTSRSQLLKARKWLQVQVLKMQKIAV